ncbi:amidase [Amorphus sp. MBR-141]
MTGPSTVLATGERLDRDETSAVAEAERCLTAALDPAGEGARAFTLIDADRTRVEAQASDLLRAQGIVPSPLAGIPISVKDLFDVTGQITKAGSVARDGAPAAAADATAIARLRAAGAVMVGRTNMTEFAYSGVGLNPHFGTPAAPWRRDERRIPGGSTSGGAVSVTDGMALAAIGTDTGGSCRIPAACCGLVGFKPTARRIPQTGCFPLSPSLDSIGSIGHSVDCVALIDAVMAGEAPLVPAAIDLSVLRIAVPTNYLHVRMDETVAAAFEAGLGRLSAAGARIVEMTLPVLDRLPELAAGGGIVAGEAYHGHRDLIAVRGDTYDPRVLTRILGGQGLSCDDYLTVMDLRRAFIAEADDALAGFDALAMPTIPIVPPKISEFDDDEAFGDLNRLLLRNPSAVNLLDRCAISLPVTGAGGAPAGLSLMGPAMGDRRLLAIARAAEYVLGA